MWIHLTALMGRDTPLLTRPDVAGWLWPRMREAFPGAIAALLMPDHPHLMADSVDAPHDRLRFARLLGQFARRFDIRHAAEVGDAEPIRAGIVLARQVRYIVLNPCRDGLARCPLEWLWSTHRDVVGATADPWVTAPRLAAALGHSANGFAERHHTYVSADPSTAVAGTPFPVDATPTCAPLVGLGDVAVAAAAALRVPIAALREHGPARGLFAALAHEQGWVDTRLLADLCDCVPLTIRRARQEVDVRALAAARRCLGDARLRSAVAPAEVAAWAANAARSNSPSEPVRSAKMNVPRTR